MTTQRGRPRRGTPPRAFGVSAPARVVAAWRAASAQTGWSISRLLLEAWRGRPAVAPVFDVTPSDPNNAACFPSHTSAHVRLSWPEDDHAALRAWASSLDLSVGSALTLLWRGWAAQGGLVRLPCPTAEATTQGAAKLDDAAAPQGAATLDDTNKRSDR